MDGVTAPLLLHPQDGLVRWAGGAAHLASLGVHVRRHRQQRTSEWPQGTRWRHIEVTMHNAMLRFRRNAIVLVARGVSTLPARRVTPLALARCSRPPSLRMLEVGPLAPRSTGFDVGGFGLRMVGVGLALVLWVVIERLATP